MQEKDETNERKAKMTRSCGVCREEWQEEGWQEPGTLLWIWSAPDLLCGPAPGLVPPLPLCMGRRGEILSEALPTTLKSELTSPSLLWGVHLSRGSVQVLGGHYVFSSVLVPGQRTEGQRYSSEAE